MDWGGAFGPWFLVLLCSWALAMVSLGACQQPEQRGGFLVSSFSRPEASLRPYEWSYLRVDVPLWFSSLTMTFITDGNIDKETIKHLPESSIALVCFKNGSPPLPDVSESYLKNLLTTSDFSGAFGGIPNHNGLEQCLPFQENMTVTLRNEQIHPGVWYLGFFNGLGPARMQSIMITRGRTYVLSTRIDIKQCATATIWGPFCNQTIGAISCSQPANNLNSRSLLDGTMYRRESMDHLSRSVGHLGASDHLQSEMNATSNSNMLSSAADMITCNSSVESSCLGYGELKYYFLDIVGVTFGFEVVATEFRSEMNFVNTSAVSSGMILMCYARYGALPLNNLYDHSADVSKGSLVVKSPKIGRWFIAVQAINQTKPFPDAKFCFSFDWRVHECFNGKVGLNCTWESHMLQRIPRRRSVVPFESYYLPIDGSESKKSGGFSLGHLMSNSSVDNVSWTYFFLDVPTGAAGFNLHVQVISGTKMDCELYCKFGGIPFTDTWDYYANSTIASNGSMLLASDDPGEDRIDFYILYAMEGTWGFGLKHPSYDNMKDQITMSVSLEACPKHCSSNGECRYAVDGSGMAIYSYCSCDRNHGGVDCSIELVSPKGHIWHSIFLIGSNAAAILPAFWALRQKAFAEWVLFTSSGISSGLYHACDVGTWCALSFHVLQFMDFWLSFMAVVSTFVYMATIDDASKRAMHTGLSILTALLAVTGATRSANIALVIAIGTLGLLVGWLLEFTASRSRFCPPRFDLNMLERWERFKLGFCNLIETLWKRFHWQFILLGFIALAVAAISWKLETNESYWIWHSLWHVAIYSSSFFFLCSMSTKSDDEEDRQPAYELTRQDSSSRIE